jgi:hypothetical protein
MLHTHLTVKFEMILVGISYGMLFVVQFFLSNRAVYLLLWNIRLGYEHAGIDFWLSSIACHAPKAPVIIVGSHKDQVDDICIIVF